LNKLAARKIKSINMYAIVDIKGKQFKVEKNQTVDVPKLNEKVGSKIEFDNVLLTNDNGKVSTKTSMKVVAKVVSHEVDDKVIVFKMKRRKGYQKKNGHKQQFTTIKIQDLKTAKKTATKKTTAKKKAEENKD
tara:strand:+ start:690 stop:1088 length:399 start_codon:yes stop_codon:yes gene_type:complete